MTAWERLHNEASIEYPHESELSYETYSNKEGWESSPLKQSFGWVVCQESGESGNQKLYRSM